MSGSLYTSTPDIADDVTASEAASYAYCAKAWHLEHVLDQSPSPRAVAHRDAGTNAHLAHGAGVTGFRRRTLWLLGGSLLMLAVGIVLLLAGASGAQF